MTRRAKFWMVAGALFSIANVAGAAFAAWKHELPHSSLHLALALISIYPVWRFALNRGGHRELGAADTPAPSAEYEHRLANLEGSIDTVAIEIERIGEGQRFMTRILSERNAAQAPGKPARSQSR